MVSDSTIATYQGGERGPVIFPNKRFFLWLKPRANVFGTGMDKGGEIGRVGWVAKEGLSKGEGASNKRSDKAKTVGRVSKGKRKEIGGEGACDGLSRECTPCTTKRWSLSPRQVRNKLTWQKRKVGTGFVAGKDRSGHGLSKFRRRQQGPVLGSREKEKRSGGKGLGAWVTETRGEEKSHKKKVRGVTWARGMDVVLNAKRMVAKKERDSWGEENIFRIK